MNQQALKTKWVNQFKQLPSQSDFHEQVREIFRTHSWFKNLTCYQEIPVKDLIPSYYSNQHRFDWYIEELKIVVELHGAQHYKATNFGSTSYDATQKAFKEGKQRDSDKQEAAEEAGYKYIAISYKEIPKLNGDYLTKRILGE